MKGFIKKRLNEELTKSDVKDEVNKVLDSNTLEDIVSRIVKEKLKNNPELEKDMVEISKNVITQFHKTIWTKRGFWQSTLKNKAA